MRSLQSEVNNRGGAVKVAAALGISVQRLCNWMDRGVPLEMCAAVEMALGGAVRRWDLRPHDWHLIWPELIGAEGAPAAPTTASPAEREAA